MTRDEITLRHRNWIIAVLFPAENPALWEARREAAKAAVESQDRSALQAAGGRLIEVAEEEISAFGGKLRRGIVGDWSWVDGRPEPLVRDLHARENWPNYCLRPWGEGTVVEVLVRDLQPDSPLARELAWCRLSAVAKDLSSDHTGMRVIHDDGRMTRAYADPASGETTGARVIPEVLLVPLHEWERRGFAVCGVQWSVTDQDVIFRKARSLGWSGD